ncbi:response regulator [Rubrobacter calidifluminis]|uniref:response regulator n=1 Tax=Rubrobacter calidifluminis TaxID=1392640 RepID=UPI00236248BF|nr:response regulator transcription factor [Rubrobacter calidifluminis]
MNQDTSRAFGRDPTRLVLVDDHELARQSIRVLLADLPDIRVIGEASNGREAIRLCGRLRPDMVMMDVRMPEMDGLEATREIKLSYPRISVLMLTVHDNPDYLLEALKVGAAGYVLKDADRQEIIAAIRRVREGDSPIDSQLATRLLKRLASEVAAQEGARKRPDSAGIQQLTPRELEVLELLKLGRTNRQIAEELYISVGTAKNHVEHIINKMGVSDRTQAVVRALEVGLIDFSGS